MRRPPRLAASLALAVAVVVGAMSHPARAQSVTLFPDLRGMLHWRMIGPFRGGRSLSATGVAGDPRTFYFGAAGGGLWKTSNAGRTWAPMMDAQPVASIGAVAVAPSDPNVVYVGSGEADMRSDIAGGNGMYRSNDAGSTWTHIGLDDSRQIGSILVDPSDPRTLLVAALGHAYGPNPTRGVFRSIDGGAHWKRVLYRDDNTGAIDLASAPSMHVVFASLWQTRRPPWSVYPPSLGPGSGLYRSADGGRTWRPVRGNGFPSEGVGKIGLAVAPRNARRVYAIVFANKGGLYRSDDGGTHWALVNGDRRLWERGWYFCHVTVDPHDADRVYVSNTSLYRSSDGGAHVTAIKGSPDGDDFHRLWIDPVVPSRMVLASDQGTTVSIDSGATWSSWFNQPTGQFYHVATDTSFPYRLFGAQQDSGAAMIVSRSDHAGIQERDWRPITAAGESGAIAIDPPENNTIYGSDLVREDLRSFASRAISPIAGRPGIWRTEWTQPIAFGSDHALYYANQFVFRSRDGGNVWEKISDALALPSPEIPDTLDDATAHDADGPQPQGVVYALAPSPVDAKVLWAGTDDGVVYLTTDAGRTWRRVGMPDRTAWSHIAGIEASHFDAGTAYYALDRHRLDDNRPFIYITHDAARSAFESHAGIPDGAFVNAVREDPVERNLLYAATEKGVYVSLDTGENWHSLRLNMPVVSVRDISVRDGDLAIATHGRAFWILDDITPLRALAHAGGVVMPLMPLRDAIRTRPGSDEAEASPPETPAGENPANGAYINYTVPAASRGPVFIDILAASSGQTPLRHYASTDPVRAADPKDVNFPAYWIPTAYPPPAQAGAHRFVWDFHLSSENGPLAPPGRYIVQVTIGAQTYRQPLVLKRDPRVAASDADLLTQARLAVDIDALAARTGTAITAMQKRKPSLHGSALAELDALLGEMPADDPSDGGAALSNVTPSLRANARLLGRLFASVESADSAPTATERDTWGVLQPRAAKTLAQTEAFFARSGTQK